MKYVIHITSDSGSCSFPLGYYSGKYIFQHDSYANGEDNYSGKNVKKYRSRWKAEKVLSSLMLNCINVNRGEIIEISA